MQPTMCARCHKNMAVIFITKIENNQSHNEGLCLSCARELHIKPVDDMISRMGLSDEDLENLSGEMTNALGEGGLESLMGMDPTDQEEDEGDGDEDDQGKTATFPFLNRLFGGPQGQMDNNSLTPSNASNGAASNSMGSSPGPGPNTNPSQSPGERRGNNKKKFLENYCISLTQRAREGKLDRMIGREEELERVIQILNRRQKNNPCLIGEPGVGKTAIAEGLAQRIADDEVPYKLRDKEVYLLDLTSLVAGTQFRGQFESRMKGLIDEIRKQGNIILMIDEIHNIVGAGDAEGSMNAANILKPALSRGEIQVIGATTFTEYRKHIEKDAALERRFQPVTVAEPSIDDSTEILKGIRRYYEDFHEVEISDEMCRLAVTLSERYITDRYLPDKAIDLLDEACSDVDLKNPDSTRKLQLERENADLEKEREFLLTEESENFERLAQIRSRQMQISDELSVLQAKGRPALTAGNLARIIELWTKIPATNITEDEFERLGDMNHRLKEHIIGQDEAVDVVCAAIKRSRVGLQAKRKPCSFIFVGSTGIGKTELVKQLAKDMFSAPESLIRLDMSEFMEKFSVSRIIGSPPGYVGYDEAGQLTEKIRRRPYSVVLFDEIEKAHPDVMNILLQILDDGRITDAQGRTVNFENTIIVMTTNAGSDNRTGGGLGFGQSISEMGKERTMKALQEFLRPEFINRVDEIVYFKPLSEDTFRGIAELMLRELRTVMEERKIAFTWDDSVIDYLVEKSYSITYGARNLRRQIQKDIEDAIAAEIIDKHKGQVRSISVGAEDGNIIIAAI